MLVKAPHSAQPGSPAAVRLGRCQEPASSHGHKKDAPPLPFFFLCDAMQCTSYHVWDRSHEIVSIGRLLFLAASVIVLSCARKRRLLYIQHSIFLDGFYRSNCLYTCDFFIDIWAAVNIFV